MQLKCIRLLDQVFWRVLAYELREKGLKVEQQKPIPIIYKEVKLDCGYRIDLLVEGSVVIELKAIEAFSPVHEAQILTYMNFAEKEIGLLINFNVLRLKEGIKRYRK